MAEYLTPGVYVEEYDNSLRSIEGVGTSTAGFVGLAEKGPAIGAPVLVTSFKSFTSQFGGFLSEFAYGEYRYLANSVEQFFINGGTRCYVSRVIPEDALSAKKELGILSVCAANEGKWGNRIQISFHTATRRKLQLIAESKTGYIAKSVEGFREGDLVEVDGEYNRIATIFDNTITFEQPFASDVVDTGIIPKTTLRLVTVDVSIRYNDEAESFGDVSFNPSAPNYIGTRMLSSELVKVSVAPFEVIGNPVEAILGEGNPSGMINLEDGSDGSISKITAATFIGVDGGPGRRTGIQSFVENDVVSMMAVPGITDPEVIVSLTAYCESSGNRIAIFDMPKDMYKTKDLIEFRNLIDSTYAAMYHPWIQVFDRSSNKSDYVPPCGAVMGIYARTDANRGVHKAPANETVFCSNLNINYTRAEQDILNPQGVNLIRILPGQGIRVWGARTASSDQAFKYVNVRRLFIYVEESIKANTNWVVFEPNDAALWQRVNLTISSFLDGLWRSGMLAGSTPAEGYFVEIGLSTMSRDDLINGRLICNVGIAPSRPAEFVIFRVTQFTAEAGGTGGFWKSY